MADNFTFLDGAAATRTARAVDNASVHLPATVLAAADGTVIAADDAAAAGPIFPMAGVYQSTVDEIDANDVGRVRVTARRVQIMAADGYRFRVAQADVNAASKTINDVVFTNLYSLKLGSTDGSNYANYTDARIFIPVGAAGFRNLEVIFYASAATYHNKDITMAVYPTSDTTDNLVAGKVLSITLPQTAFIYFSFSSSGAAGQGGVVGGAIAAAGSYYSVLALKDVLYATILLSSATIPTSGAFEAITISRTS